MCHCPTIRLRSPDRTLRWQHIRRRALRRALPRVAPRLRGRRAPAIRILARVETVEPVGHMTACNLSCREQPRAHAVPVPTALVFSSTWNVRTTHNGHKRTNGREKRRLPSQTKKRSKSNHKRSALIQLFILAPRPLTHFFTWCNQLTPPRYQAGHPLNSELFMNNEKKSESMNRSYS